MMNSIQWMAYLPWRSICPYIHGVKQIYTGCTRPSWRGSIFWSITTSLATTIARVIFLIGSGDSSKNASMNLSSPWGGKSAADCPVVERLVNLDDIKSSGELASDDSSDSRKKHRSIAGTEPLQRKICGAKVDMLFRHAAQEYGCTETNRSRRNKTTKELNESSLKCRCASFRRHIQWRLTSWWPLISLSLVQSTILTATMDWKLISYTTNRSESHKCLLGLSSWLRGPSFSSWTSFLSRVWGVIRCRNDGFNYEHLAAQSPHERKAWHCLERRSLHTFLQTTISTRNLTAQKKRKRS